MESSDAELSQERLTPSKKWSCGYTVMNSRKSCQDGSGTQGVHMNLVLIKMRVRTFTGASGVVLLTLLSLVQCMVIELLRVHVTLGVMNPDGSSRKITLLPRGEAQW